LFERFVVPVFVLLNHTLKTNKTANLVPQVIALQEQQESRYATVAVAERMNTQEIKIHRCHSYYRMYVAFIKTVTPRVD